MPPVLLEAGSECPGTGRKRGQPAGHRGGARKAALKALTLVRLAKNIFIVDETSDEDGQEGPVGLGREQGALDLQMSGVPAGLEEHKRDILKLREEMNGVAVEVDAQKNSRVSQAGPARWATRLVGRPVSAGAGEAR